MRPSLFYLLQEAAGDELMAAAVPVMLAKLKLTPERLGLLLAQMVNPDLVLSETDEATLRGMSPTTLRGMKVRGELPPVIQGQGRARS